jgi:RND family efflux transporter MFP subunit
MLARGEGTDSRSTPRERIVLERCLLENRSRTELGTPNSGILQDCLVELGDQVKAGQVLGRVRDLEQRAERDLQSARAESDIAIRVAEAKFHLAERKQAQGDRLLRQSAITSSEYDDLKTGTDLAQLELEEAKFNHKISRLLYRRAEAAVRVCEIVSPHDGVVTKIYKQKGEAVDLLQPALFRVVNTDVLRVTGFLDVTDAWRVRPGQEVQISAQFAGPDRPIKRERFAGTVIFVDTEIDSRTQTCKIVAEVQNRDNLLKAGLEARMEINSNPGASRKAD